MNANSIVLLSTRKGLIEYHRKGDQWQQKACHFQAIPVTFTYEDPRNGYWWACLDHGHWGVKLHRSVDKGKSWEEIEAPKYPEGMQVKENMPAKTEYIWSMVHGGVDQREVLWMGTIPGGLFKSSDNGKTWQLNEPLWYHPSRKEHWFGAGFDHPGIHSIIVDPRDSDHLIVGISVAGVFETMDGGESWQPRNKGLLAEFLPDPDSEVGHDPHILASSEAFPDTIWQQNHCGIFRSDDNGKSWQSVSEKGKVAHFGFAIAADESNKDVAWVAPAIADEYRIAVDQALCICRTDDGGKTWQELRNGLPQENCYDIIYRHALASDGDRLVFGTTTGNAFYSNNRGEQWQVLSNYLPLVHAVTFATI